MSRPDGRSADQLREIKITRGWLEHAEGSALIEFGATRVLCAASATEEVPRWRRGSGLGWVTAEYAMLPRATNTRGDRESIKGRPGGRTQEISRLVGRSLRACVDAKALGENTIIIDCDVLQADGGTSTAAITGGYLALADAVGWLQGRRRCKGDPLVASVAAVSVGIVDGEPRLDLCYEEDVAAQTDMNVVCTGDGSFVEIQGTAEREPFGRELLDELLDLGVAGCAELTTAAAGRPAAMTGLMTDPRAKIILATHNPDKLAELRRILVASRVDVDVADLGDHPDMPQVAETGATFERERPAEGARGGGPHRPARGRRRLRPVRRRAERHARRALGPLVRRRHGDDEANLRLLLAQLADVPADRRAAHFYCVAALVLPSGAEHVTEGTVHGWLTDAPRGTNGFGYDPIFVPGSSAETTAELTPEEKDAISHRGKALRALAPVIAALLGG